MAEPAQVTAGDTWTWTRPGGDYPASLGWTLSYYLAKAAETPLTIAATAAGSDFAVSVPATTTDDYPAGTYHWTARVSKAGEVHVVDTGVLDVLPDPSVLVDRRTHNEKCLAAINAVLEGLTSDPITEYEVDGFKVKRIAHGELMRLRSVYESRVRVERGSKPVFRSFPVRFNP